MRKTKAFTLIELLVVIAIIAILAAILFPVFAQAKEKAKQTVCTSNMKSWADSIHMYTQDHDDTYPLAMAERLGWWEDTQYHAVPPDWRPSMDGTNYPNEMRSAWGNSVFQYIKDHGIYTCPSALPSKIGDLTDYADPLLKPADVSYTYNGYLHQWNGSGIVNPSDLTVIWEGRGKSARKGYARHNPFLYCDEPIANATRECIYRFDGPSAGAARGWMFGIGETIWIHNGGAVFAFTDTHAKWRRLGAQYAANPSSGHPYTDHHVDPFTGYNLEGRPGWYWVASGDDGLHAFLFRPIYDFLD